MEHIANLVNRVSKRVSKFLGEIDQIYEQANFVFCVDSR